MGVRRAVETTIGLVEAGKGKIATFGPLIHNPQVLEMLEKHGVDVISAIPEEISGTVVIRAHGVPPEEKEKLESTGAFVEDATCPRVLKVQAIIARYKKEGFATVIIGDKDHAEIKGLMGYAGDTGQVVSCEREIDNLDLHGPYIIVSQTTQDEALFHALKNKILKRHPDGKVFNTICDSTHKRQEEVRQLCEKVDALIVVGGRNSANTQRLGEIAQGLGCPVFMVESEEDLDLEKIAAFGTVGVTAGASTPNWVINSIVEVLENLKANS